MLKVEWSSDYEVGNFEIDAQHMLFVSLIHKITEKVEAGAEKERVELLLVELLKYAEFHFCSEENIMIEHGYPQLLEHKYAHEKLLAKLRNRLFSLKYDFIDFDKLQLFLVEWFTEHTGSVDKDLAEFIVKLEK